MMYRSVIGSITVTVTIKFWGYLVYMQPYICTGVQSLYLFRKAELGRFPDTASISYTPVIFNNLVAYHYPMD